MTISQSVIVDWLRAGGPWGEAPEVIETHAAFVFLIDSNAYKLKKAVNLGYLDFSSCARRGAVLDRELRLNRRTAPTTYLRTLPIFHRADGTLSLKESGEVVDWLLEMQRFPSDALLSHAAERHTLSEKTIESLAAIVADFHDHAEIVSDYDWPSAITRIVLENAADLRSQTKLFGSDKVESAVAACAATMPICAATLRHQSADTRRCHGDLHLGNIFLAGDRPTLFDCIEFDEFYATIPPLYDLAFLLSDLLARDLRRLANRAFNAWLIHRDQDRWRDVLSSLDALPLYLAVRLGIRAKVEARRPGGESDARRFLEMMAKVLQPSVARLVAIGGLSGTGKTALAKTLAWRFGLIGAVHLRSDEIRKRTAGVGMLDRLPSSAYTKDASGRIYLELGELAQAALTSGQAVFVDAVFASEAERANVAALAAKMGVPFVGLWLDARQDVLERRLASRLDDASDADRIVLSKQLEYNVGEVLWHRLDASGSESEVSTAARARLGF